MSFKEADFFNDNLAVTTQAVDSGIHLLLQLIFLKPKSTAEDFENLASDLV